MDKQQNRYKKDVPADDMPKSPAAPELKLCQFSNGRLVIPTDIRKHFLNCPIYGPEWREIIVKFDKDWGVAVQPDPAAASPQPQGSGTPNGSPAPATSGQVKEEVKLEPGFQWSSVFSTSPQTVEKLREKFGADFTEMAGASSTSSFFLCPGPQLFIVAKEPLHIKAADSQIISHGAGSWLTGEKATKFASNNPDRAIPCQFSSDEQACIFEERDFRKKYV
jgi:hypothetical protein